MLLLIRHGATKPNLAKPPILQGGGIDSELAETGIEQARQVAAALRDRPIAAIYASPLKRAQATATIIAEPHGLDVGTATGIEEISAGRWEGKTWPEVMASDADAYARWIGDPGEQRYPGGESYVDVAGRAIPVLERIAADHAEELVAVVAHRAVNRAVLGRLLGLDPRRWKDLPQDNTAVNTLRWNGDALALVTMNNVDHLA